MNIPLNGRIAIVDNEEEEARPLMKVFSKNQIPYVFYKGDDKEYLPDEDARYNDIRLLFLDINLLGNRTATDKEIKSSLYPVLKRIVSENNYPYSIIYWSKQETEYKKVVEDLFQNELKDRAPINIVPFKKSNFFNMDGTPIENGVNLIKEIEAILANEHAYGYLLEWENKIHLSTDKTLQEIFSSYHTYGNWSHNANYLFNKLGISYSGKAFEEQAPEEKIKSSFNALSIVLNDTIEVLINNSKVDNAVELTVPNDLRNKDSIQLINRKLLTSDEKYPIHYSGTVIECSNSKYDDEYIMMLDTVLKKEKDKDQITASWKKIWIIVTPLCDTVQGKIVFHRIVRGLLIDSKFANSFHSNDAIYVTPSFSFEELDCSILLDFRHLFCRKILKPSTNLKPLFRIRQQLLAEIQSKLSRHINRQGVLFLDGK